MILIELIVDKIRPVAICYFTDYYPDYFQKNISDQQNFRIKIFEEKNEITF